MKKFDPNQPHDTCHGNDELGRAFFQDGVYFDSNGDEVVEGGDDDPEELTEEEIAAKAEAAAAAKAAKAAKAAAA